MDPRCFDQLVKAFGTQGASRRDVVRRIAGGVVGAAAAMLGLRTATACTGQLCNVDSECCTGTNCLNGGCNPCAAAGATCSSRKPCCRQTRTTCCGTICVNTRTSNNHCGACGNTCLKGTYCSTSKCCPLNTVNRKGICCPFTHQNCNGECKNLQSDKENCGTCGNQCADNFICSKGKCCPNGRINCSGVCVNLRTDENNCGACGRRCASTSRCVDRACTPLEQ